MCHGRGSNNKISNIHERALRIVYHEKISNFKTLLKSDKSASIHMKSKLWNLLPGEIKNSSSLTVFKNKIRNWIPEKCPCKLCQTYIKNVGYI